MAWTDLVNFPWLSGDVPKLPPYGGYISQLVRCAMCCTGALDISIVRIFKSLQNYCDTVIYTTSFENHLESSSGHTLDFYPNLVKYRFKNVFLKKSPTGFSTVL